MSNAAPPNRSQSVRRTRCGGIAAVLAAGVLAEAVLIPLGQTYGSTREERAMRLLGDDIVPLPQVVTNHAITDFVMARDMLNGVKQRSEALAQQRSLSQ
jgi:hypothetical protein